MINKFKKLFFLVKNLKEKKENYLDYQLDMFKKNGLDRQLGLKIFNEIILKNQFLNSEMHSEHQIIFCSIASQGLKVQNILEIGTYDAKNACLLSKLFPNSKIITLDLPDSDKKFKNFYGRKKDSKFKNFIEKRDNLLKECKNVFFKKMNSINLLLEKQKFDLIWIDGAHGYPFVTIDIINALRLCEDNGLIMCDDIYKHKIENSDQIYFSNASLETLKLLSDENLLIFDLFLKRIEKKYNYFPKEKKFIAIVKKLKNF